MASASGAMLDIQSLPSLERFDSQLLDLFKQNPEPGAAGVHVMDEMQAPDDDLALQRLMTLKNSQQKAAAAALQHQAPGIPHSAFAQHPHHHFGQVNTAATAAGLEAAHAAAQQLMTQAAQESYLPTPSDILGGRAGLAAGSLVGTIGTGFLGGMGLGEDMCIGQTAPVTSNKRRNRGSRLDDIIKTEQDGDGDGDQEDSRDSTQSPSKRARSTAVTVDSDFEGPGGPSAGLAITPDMDEATRAKIRREKNRVAARKCRAKKMQFMVELQKTLRELMRKNEEYRLQVITWHKMFSREVRLREAMKRIIAVMWQSGVSPSATGYTANDVIIGLESGTLDINSLIRSLAAINSTPGLNQLPNTTLAAPAPLIINSPSGNPANSAMPPATPRGQTNAVAPSAATAGGLLAVQMSNSMGDLSVLPTAAGAGSDSRGLGNGAAGLPGPTGSPSGQSMVQQSLLMSHSSHISSASPFAAAGAAQASAGSGPVRLGSGGATAAAAGAEGVAVPGMADIAAQSALEGGWLWADSIGGGSVGPSCITTGMQE
eukprot:GHRR01000297.1.p1 GENE.GHRR01000297.1~~GHRR01000297.1.p1  ORF type:complete len:543 (+),score=214.40 GHRR01000297.1:437-2065(+)